MSTSTTLVYTVKFANRLLKANYFYQCDPWQIKSPAAKCPFHHQV
ncbi:hypothetical protein [Nostoc sp.]